MSEPPPAHMRVGVIGAGPAGLTAAYKLVQQGVDVAIFEAGAHVGGLARSFELWGHRVDLGPHRFFSKDERVNALWRGIVGSDYRMVKRLSRIFYRRRFFDYPLSIGNVLVNLGPIDVIRSLASYATERIKPERKASDRSTFEDWVVHNFGRHLFEMFFKSYSEKLWGIPCSALDADFAAQRIRRFSLGQSILAALGIGKARHKTLVDVFAYPTRGSGDVYDRMTRAIIAAGGSVNLRSPVTRILTTNGKATGIELQDGRARAFDHVISTMPLTLLVQGLGDLPSAISERVARLRFRNTILVYLKVEAKNLFPDQWIYIHSSDVAVGRVTNFRNWVPELHGGNDFTVLALEYWCYDEDALWAESDDMLVMRGKQDIRAIGLAGSAPVSAGHVERVRRCYPVYSRGYRATLAPIIDHLKSIANLWPIGRYGSFKYNNQDHSILMGLLAADNIGNGATHDLWLVNTDYDDYQEDAKADE